MSTQTIVVVGSNHEYASVDLRERLAFVGETLADGLIALHRYVDEGFILSTCNRTEIYVAATDAETGYRKVFDFLAGYHSVPLHVLERYSYAFAGNEAVEHLYRVASGLDSMVLGEPQILSQIRDALDTARDAHSVGPALQRLATEALRIGKRARTETDISRNRLSIAHAALDLAKHELGELTGKSVLVLGAGKMATLAAKLLHGRGVREITIVNRSLPAAQTLARQIGGGVIPFNGLAHALDRADLVVAAVGAEHKVITPDVLRPRATPLLLVDLSVPRTVDTGCEAVAGVSVRDVDALEGLAEAARAAFATEVAKVEELVQEAVTDFNAWSRSRAAAGAIAAMQARAATVRDGELDRALRKLTHLSNRDLNVVRALASGISNKLLHEPLSALRRAGSPEEIEQITTAFGVTVPRPISIPDEEQV